MRDFYKIEPKMRKTIRIECVPRHTKFILYACHAYSLQISRIQLWFVSLQTLKKTMQGICCRKWFAICNLLHRQHLHHFCRILEICEFRIKFEFHIKPSKNHENNSSSLYYNKNVWTADISLFRVGSHYPIKFFIMILFWYGTVLKSNQSLNLKAYFILNSKKPKICRTE